MVYCNVRRNKLCFIKNLINLVLFLIIPGVNWVTEVVVRWSAALNKKDIVNLILAIAVTIGGIVFGWIDFIWVILTGHLTFAD